MAAKGIAVQTQRNPRSVHLIVVSAMSFCANQMTTTTAMNAFPITAPRIAGEAAVGTPCTTWCSSKPSMPHSGQRAPRSSPARG